MIDRIKRCHNGIIVAAIVACMAVAVLVCGGRPAPRTRHQPAVAGDRGILRLPGRVLIDINTADRSLLMELPGIGEVMADSIIAHREENGPFEDSSALIEVRGIGRARLSALTPLVGAGLPQGD